MDKVTVAISGTLKCAVEMYESGVICCGLDNNTITMVDNRTFEKLTNVDINSEPHSLLPMKSAKFLLIGEAYLDFEILDVSTL